jgi:hypothetical protein
MTSPYWNAVRQAKLNTGIGPPVPSLRLSVTRGNCSARIAAAKLLKRPCGNRGDCRGKSSRPAGRHILTTLSHRTPRVHAGGRTLHNKC